MEELTPGLMLVHGNRAEQLRDILVAWLRHAPLAPLENECVLVQSNGIAQWLRLALARGDTGCGVAAGLEFLLPSRFLWQAYRAVLGPDQVPEQSPLDKSALTWRLLRLLPDLVDRPSYAPLARFLADDPDMRRRFQLAGKLADLFDQYQVYRADWLEAWTAGSDILIDGYGRQIPLPLGQSWQPDLWRAVLADVGAGADDCLSPGRAAVHEAFMRRAAQDFPGDAAMGGPAAVAGGRTAGVPRRILVFGVSAMPAQALEALAALARWSQILMCVHNPCAHYWADIVPDRDMLRARYRRQGRRPGMPEGLDAVALHAGAHPLLAAWGKQGRDFIGMLDDFDDPQARERHSAAFAAMHQRLDAFEALPGDTLLQQLQDDVRDLRPVSETRARWPAVDPQADESIRFHVAHSPLREVEILHDRLLDAFDRDPALRPWDVIVMVPDIETYAPHVQAVFGLHDAHDSRFIPYALADQGPRQVDPLLLALGQLLDLAGLRVGLSHVLEWLDVPALRARFGIREQDLPILHAWIKDANIRWGLNAAQRAEWGAVAQDARATHSWRFGLRRMLLGYAAGLDAPAWRDIQPYGEVGGLDAALLGPLEALIRTLEHYWDLLRQPATPSRWLDCFLALADDFFLAEEAHDDYTLTRFREAVQTWSEACVAAGLDEPIPAAIPAQHCLAAFDQTGLSQRFFGGAVTFATLMPMRAIPFRRVCLLGMQDGAYPRIRVPVDFDLMAGRYRPGDRSRREDDRYLFLEAMLSARDQLYVSWVGRSIQDNTALPPSVLVAQLRDHLDAGWRLAETVTSVSEAATDAHETPAGTHGTAGGVLEKVAGKVGVAAALTLEHPLQPFSRRYFPANPQSGPAALYTYAHEWREARSRASAAAPSTDGQMLELPDCTQPLTLARLRRFLRHPIQCFFQDRLSIFFDSSDPGGEDHEPYERDALDAWGLRDGLLDVALHACRRGDDPVSALKGGLTALGLSGDLVPGSLGQLDADALGSSLEGVLGDAQRAWGRWPLVDEAPLRIDYDLALENKYTLNIQDLIPGLRRDADGNRVRVLVQASHVVKNNAYRPSALIEAWVTHLAAHAAGHILTTLVFSPQGSVAFEALDPGGARAGFDALLHGWVHGMRMPLPVTVQCAVAWLRKGASSSREDRSWVDVEACYQQALGHDPYLRRAYPDFARFSEGSGFEHWSRQLYGDLSDAISTVSAAMPDVVGQGQS